MVGDGVVDDGEEVVDVSYEWIGCAPWEDG